MSRRLTWGEKIALGMAFLLYAATYKFPTLQLRMIRYLNRKAKSSGPIGFG